jgi:hypothetical protein
MSFQKQFYGESAKSSIVPATAETNRLKKQMMLVGISGQERIASDARGAVQVVAF